MAHRQLDDPFQLAHGSCGAVVSVVMPTGRSEADYRAKLARTKPGPPLEAALFLATVGQASRPISHPE
jgi:hypothetical protein